MKWSSKCVVDTNVPITANLAVSPNEIPIELAECVLACIEAIEQVTRNGGLVIDTNNEIFNEYRHQLSLKGQPGVGDRFLRWVHDHQWVESQIECVDITKNGDSYDQFPAHEGLSHFDPSDRKFVAVANAHPDRPPILQATDSKWWGWRDALSEVGIEVRFLCPEYVESKFEEKIGS